jgi:hypothetical protein
LTNSILRPLGGTSGFQNHRRCAHTTRRDDAASAMFPLTSKRRVQAFDPRACNSHHHIRVGGNNRHRRGCAGDPGRYTRLLKTAPVEPKAGPAISERGVVWPFGARGCTGCAHSGEPPSCAKAASPGQCHFSKPFRQSSENPQAVVASARTQRRGTCTIAADTGRQCAYSAAPPPSACRGRLTPELALVRLLPSITGPNSCGGGDIVLLEAVVLEDGQRVALVPAATLRCPMAEAVVRLNDNMGYS